MLGIRGHCLVLAMKGAARAGGEGVIIHRRMDLRIGHPRAIGEALVGVGPAGIEDGEFHEPRGL
jgi:hypothetical protein